MTRDEEEIRAVIDRNRIAVWTRDYDAYQRCFVHAPYTARWNASPVSGIHVRQGWDEISGRVQQMFATYRSEDDRRIGHANAYETEIFDLSIRVSGDMAWATFRQKYPNTPSPSSNLPTRPWHHAGTSPSHEVRFLERHNGEWRIAFLGFLDADAAQSASALLRLDADGVVEWQNEAAAGLLAQEDDLVLRNGRLRVRDARTDARLRAAIKWAAALSAPMVPGRGSLPIVMQAGEGLPSRVWWIIAESGRIYFSLGTPGQDEQRLEAASIVYELSPAQKEVAGHIIAGRTMAEIAEAMGITVNTVRTHLDRVFDKTGVRTQAALVRVLLSAAAPV
ncbi:MAG TPA: helix-turn-helix transcriptional regulator [Devosia sp.]|nr:helix-turn-helix transcriptional regulator [Devosia sp.]